MREPPDNDLRPVPPVCPALEECCQSGCVPCIFDLYDAALERYRDELAAWEQRRAKQGNSKKGDEA